MNNMISDELMDRFYSGNVTGEEIKMVLLAAEHDPNLKEEIEIMTSISGELSNIRVKREDISGAKVISLSNEESYPMAAESFYIDKAQITYLPMWRLAAESKVYGQEMKAPNDCVVQCEQYVLQLFNIESSIETLKELSKKNKWLKEGGTPLHHIGRILSEYQLSVVRRYDCNLDIIRNELHDGCKIIVAINADKLYGKNSIDNNPNHAVVVLSADKQEVRIYDPQNEKEASFTTDCFISAWKDSHYYIVSVTKRGLRQYNPAPINASNFQLSDDLDELIEAIAENSHDIWARQRMDDGWSYGPKRDDDHKKHPDLIPYSDLSESEKEYDRKTARGILELVQRLGFKIVKE